MNNIIFPKWKKELRAAIKKEGKFSSNKWVQFATVNKFNEPRVRTVVFRGWHRENSMLIYTDKRTKKIEDLENNKNVEVLWLFLKSKYQFRFKGNAFTLQESSKEWESLSDKSKESWFWPSPGKKVNKEFSKKTEKKLIKPNNFIVLSIDIFSVELLKLQKPIHKRFVWEEDNNWKSRELNP